MQINREFNCCTPTAMIANLKDRGYDIHMNILVGANGKKYGEYFLLNYNHKACPKFARHRAILTAIRQKHRDNELREINGYLRTTEYDE